MSFGPQTMVCGRCQTEMVPKYEYKHESWEGQADYGIKRLAMYIACLLDEGIIETETANTMQHDVDHLSAHTVAIEGQLKRYEEEV